MRSFRRLLLLLLTAALALLLSLAAWMWWGDWPGSSPRGKVGTPALIVVLGGGDDARVRETLRLACGFPDVPILVTGDSGIIVHGLLSSGIPETSISIEKNASSTWENAVLSKPWVDRLKEGQIVLVTNDFHASRARAVFKKVFPAREIVVASEPCSPPYNRWQQVFRRRERAAALFYLLRYQINSFRN